ncbi:DUF4397 domain-containing protein [Haladaptatus sp. DYF46]|uniref:DUF4397 domain-containing protein n=1 Tax=Haladaptatus sp. DYF46 TaxID=2886041 RepID=UPI001E4383CC|nr:DUF4397 domain-containing protein [Haladaptatus sp. DYF46]
MVTLSVGFAGMGVMADGPAQTTAVNETTAMEETTTAAVNETSTTTNETTAATNETTAATETTTAAANETTTANETGDAQVRIAHMSPDAPPVDVLVDNETVVSNLSYGNVTDYESLPAGEHEVSITAAGDPSTVVFSGNETFDADTNYTVAATGLISGSGDTAFEPVVYEDNFTAPEQGNASVRLVHVSPDAGPVDVTVAGSNTTLFDNVSFRQATAYEQVPAGDYTLEVRPATANDSGEVLKTFDVSLNDRTAYSAFAAGYANQSSVPAGSPDRPLDLILVTDFVASGNATGAANETTTANATSTGATTTSMNATTTEAPTSTTSTSANVTSTETATAAMNETMAETTAAEMTSTSQSMTTTTANQTTTNK